MFKICFITTIPLTIKTFVLDFAKFLHSTGDFEVHFICDYDADFEKNLPEYIHYHPIAMKRGISLDGVKAIWKMMKYFREEKFDLVQYSTPNAACYASIAARIAGIRNRVYCQWGIKYVAFTGLKRKIFKFIEKTVCINSTVIEPDSFGNLRFGREEGLYKDNKSRVVWNGSASGVNLTKFDVSYKDAWRREIRSKYSIPLNATVFTFIGRITKDKGVNELFAAAKTLLSDKDDAYLMLIGNIEKSETIDPTLYDWSQTEPRVIYCGYTREVEKYLAASDVYVLPSYREGFGSAVIEAEAMGVPVIVSNIPGPTDAMKQNETGLLVEKGNAIDLQNAMTKLYNCKDKRLQMGERALEFAKNKFDQKVLFEKILEDRMGIITNK